MAQWRCDLRISLRTQLFSLLAYLALALLILVAPWHGDYAVLWLVLLALVVFECTRSQKSIASYQGEIRLNSANQWVWQKQKWRVVKQPWVVRGGVLLSLQQMENYRHQRLWLASDSMTEEEWRHLCQLLRQGVVPQQEE